MAKAVKFTARLESSGDYGWHFIYISKKIGATFPTDGKSRRVVCTLNGKERLQCALMPAGGRFCIVVNKRIRTALNIVSGDRVEVMLEPDESKYGLPMPKEFEEVMRQDREGKKLFEALTPGKKRSLIYWVSKGKNIDLRIHIALVIMQHLKDNDGRVDGDKLYHESKRPQL